MRTLLSIAAIVAAATLAGCSGPGATTSPPSATTTPMESGAMNGHDEETGALGEPGDPTAADRTIHVLASDQLAFDPASIEVAVGETITFEIENTGEVDHEFVLGSQEFQEEHEREMQEDSGMAMDEPNEVEVPAGSTETLTWHFTEAGTTQYGCHEPGHYPGGMFGTLTVSE